VTAVLPTRPQPTTGDRTEPARSPRWARPAAPRPPRPPAPPGVAVTSAVLGLVALFLLALVAEVSVVGAVRHARAQTLAFGELRSDLANGITPVGQADGDGVLVPLGKPIALLEIPAIGVHEVVRQGTTSSVLAGGPGHRRDTPYPGQPGGSLIYGRQAGYGGPFAHLDDLKRGDQVVVTTGQGQQKYKVTGLRRAGDPAYSLRADESRLTLVTATGPRGLPDGTLFVDALLVSKPVAAPPQAFGPSALPEAEKSMAGDRSAALPLLLWAQLLALCGVALVWMRSMWGRWQAWVVAVPVLSLCTLQAAHQVAMLLPNLI
jgi:sortase A